MHWSRFFGAMLRPPARLFPLRWAKRAIFQAQVPFGNRAGQRDNRATAVSNGRRRKNANSPNKLLNIFDRSSF